MNGIDREILIRHLKALGLEAGDWVAVHSSMKSIGWVEGGPEAVISSLIKAVAPGGLVMMPLFTIPDEELIDLAVKPTYLGLLPETFRNFPGVVRSLHPTHSVGIYGPEAQGIAESHRNLTYIGHGSPYHQLALNNGWVLHMGTTFNSSSIIHLAEVLAEVPYLDISYPRFEKSFTARAMDGSLVRAEPREIPGDSKMFYLVQEEMDRRNLLRKGMIGQAVSIMARASEILDVAVEMMRENPWQFLCDFPYCSACRRADKLKNRAERLAPGEKEVFNERES